MVDDMKENTLQCEKSSISRRDFLKLKSFLMLWYYFFQSFGINLFANDSIKKIDYSLLDKLTELQFSTEVMDEIKLRVDLQNKYNTDANGNILSLNRFIKEIVNFIISKKDFADFKLLNSIKDEQIDYSYMLNATAKHNEVNSMQYLQQKLISHKDDAMLNNALEYAIKSQSFDTTLHLMQQNIKLDDNSQKQLLNVLHKEEYEIFYKKISGNNQMMLPNYAKEAMPKIRKMTKKVFSFMDYSWDGSFVYDYLSTIVHNSLVDLYLQYFINEFDIYLDCNKIFITTYADVYPINFVTKFENSLYNNRFNSWESELLDILEYESDMTNKNTNQLKKHINKILYSGKKIDTYDFINIDML